MTLHRIQQRWRIHLSSTLAYRVQRRSATSSEVRETLDSISTRTSAYLSSYCRGVPTAAIKGVAITSLLLVSGLQAWSTKAGTRAQIATTAFKVIAIVAVFVAGLVYLGLGKIASSFSFEGSTHNATGYALALFSALWVSPPSSASLLHPRAFLSPPTFLTRIISHRRMTVSIKQTMSRETVNLVLCRK